MKAESSKQDFVCELMTKDDLMCIGLFGEEYETLIQSGALSKIEDAELVAILKTSVFSGELYSSDEEVIRQSV